MTNAAFESLIAAQIHFVRVLWVDNCNVIRGKAIYIGELERYRKHGVGISAGQQGVPVFADMVVPQSGLGPVGEIRLIPDWTTLTALPYAPGHARVFGDMVLNGAPWPLCPRDFLRRMIARAKSVGLEIQAAFENEFYLLRKSADCFAPADRTPFAATAAMDEGREVIDDIVMSLVAQDIPVELYYPESGPGQHEISVRHSDPLTAADRQIAFRETVRAVALRHGLAATFLPKPFVDQAGSGSHLHLSLWRDGKNIVPESQSAWGLSSTAGSFMAGILSHLPALMALTTPSVNSYQRIRPQAWCGAFRAWGLDNREAAVRVPTHPDNTSPVQFELKTVDASSNPYLALGAVLAAGLDGVERLLDPGAPIAIDPATLSAEDRTQRGIEQLPVSLGESLELLRQDTVLLDALGSNLAEAVVAVRQAEWDAMKDLDFHEEVKVLIDKY